jgi:hypothetical protein
MSRSAFAPVLFAVDIVVSILLNMGTNWIFSSISFITFAVAAILQLALAMDYSIMLMNAYDRTVNNTGSISFPYMDKILSDWIEKGIKSSAEADEYSGRTGPAAACRTRRSTRRAELPVLIEDRPNDNHNRHARADAVGLPA